MRTLSLCVLLLLVVAVRGVGADPPPPSLYAMYSHGEDLQAKYGSPIASYVWARWDEVHHGWDRYDFSVLDNRLATDEGLTLTLWSGETVPKHAQIMVVPSLSPWGPHGWIDCTPAFLNRPSYNIQGCGALIPQYDDYTWQQAYYEMLAALCDHYKDRDDVVVCIGPGVDGETHIIKPASCMDQVNSQHPGLEYRWGQFVSKNIEIHGNLLGSTLSFLNMAPGGAARAHWAGLCEDYGVGIKIAGLQADMLGWESNQPETGLGMWDMPLVYSKTLRLLTESKLPAITAESAYWNALPALHYHSYGVGLHYDANFASYFDLLPDGGSWLASHLGDPVVSAWMVFRDAECDPSCWGDVCVSCHNGPWSQYMDFVGDTTRKWRADLPECAAKDDVFSRQWFEGDFDITVSEAYTRAQSYDILITWLDVRSEGEWQVSGNGVVIVPYEGTGEWRELLLEGWGRHVYVRNGCLHKVEATARPASPPTSPLSEYALGELLAEASMRMANSVGELGGVECWCRCGWVPLH